MSELILSANRSTLSDQINSKIYWTDHWSEPFFATEEEEDIQGLEKLDTKIKPRKRSLSNLDRKFDTVLLSFAFLVDFDTCKIRLIACSLSILGTGFGERGFFVYFADCLDWFSCRL